jgi:AraC family transcriptional regulator
VASTDNTTYRSLKLSNSPQARANFCEPPRYGSQPKDIQFLVEEEDISAETVWCLDPDFHSVVVHLKGKIERFESKIEGKNIAVGSPAPGESWIVPANCKYSAAAKGETVKYAMLRLRPEFLSALAEYEGVPAELEARLALRDEFIYASARRLESIVANDDDISRTMFENIVLDLSRYLLLRYCTGHSHTRPRERKLLTQADQKRVQEYIACRLGEAITLKDLSRLLSLDNHHVLGAFHTTFGTTPAQYVIDRRLGAARILLTSTKSDMTTIAMATGFSSPSHFSSTFKKATGLTPRQFRASF